MGWNITSGRRDIQYSYTQVGELAAHLAHTLPGGDWRTIRCLFNRPSGDPFEVPPEQAAEVAEVLERAGRSKHMPAGWGRNTRALAAAARHAAVTQRPWRWS